jgi:hypothetical protein
MEFGNTKIIIRISLRTYEAIREEMRKQKRAVGTYDDYFSKCRIEEYVGNYIDKIYGFNRSDSKKEDKEED